MRDLTLSQIRYAPIEMTTSARAPTTPATMTTPVFMIEEYVRQGPPNKMEIVRLRREDPIVRANRAVAALELPEAVYKTCPWQPRALVEAGLR